MRLHFGLGKLYFECAQKLGLKVCVILIILSLFLSVQKVQTLPQLKSLQLIWPPPFQADLGVEWLEFAAGQMNSSTEEDF